MGGYFSKLARRSGLVQNPEPANIHPVQRPNHEGAAGKTPDNALHDFSTQHTVEATTTEEINPAVSHESMAESAYTLEVSDTARHPEDMTSRPISDPEPHRSHESTEGVKRRMLEEQAGNLSEAGVRRPPSSLISPSNPVSRPTDAASHADTATGAAGDVAPQIHTTAIESARGPHVHPQNLQRGHIKPPLMQTVGEQRGTLGEENAGLKEIDKTFYPESQGTKADHFEGAPPRTNEVNGKTADDSMRSYDISLSSPPRNKHDVTGRPHREEDTFPDRDNAATGRAADIRIGTVSFEINQVPTRTAEPQPPKDLIERRQPPVNRSHAKPQTQACRLSRHYLRGY